MASGFRRKPPVYGNQIRSFFPGKATTVQSSEAHNTLLFQWGRTGECVPGQDPRPLLRLQKRERLLLHRVRSVGNVSGACFGATRIAMDNPYAQKPLSREFLFVKPLDTAGGVRPARITERRAEGGQRATHPPIRGTRSSKTFILHSEELPTVSGSTINGRLRENPCSAQLPWFPISPSIRVVDEGNIPHAPTKASGTSTGPRSKTSAPPQIVFSECVAGAVGRRKRRNLIGGR